RRLADALVVAAHARDAVGHALVATGRIEHDLHRTLQELLPVGGVQVVALEAVGEREDGLAAVFLEVELAVARAERELVEALAALVAGKVIRGPEVTGRDGVALDQPVIARHAGLLEARTLGDELLEVGERVEAELRLQFAEGVGELQELV